MSLIEIILLGVALAMDASSVTIANGMIYKNLTKKDYALMPIMFGLFQGLMPVAGFFVGGIFADFITKYSGIVIFVILGAIGGKMVYDSFKPKAGQGAGEKLTFGVLVFQAVATSIDAFAVGVGFLAMAVNVYLASSIIAITTALMVIVAIFVGKAFGNIFEDKAQLIGGLVLIAIGIKALF